MSTANVIEEQLKKYGEIRQALVAEQEKLIARSTPEEIAASKEFLKNHPLTPQAEKATKEMENFKFDV